MTAVVTTRLAQAGDKGANFYNAYQLISQVAGLYDLGARHDRQAVQRSTWNDLSSSALGDIGALYALWDQIVRDPQAATGNDPKLYAATLRLCKRSGKVTELVTMWTPVLRCASLVQLVERRWLRILSALPEAAGTYATQVAFLKTQSQDRAQRLTGMIELYRREAQVMRASNQILRRAN